MELYLCLVLALSAAVAVRAAGTCGCNTDTQAEPRTASLTGSHTYCQAPADWGADLSLEDWPVFVEAVVRLSHPAATGVSDVTATAVQDAGSSNPSAATSSCQADPTALFPLATPGQVLTATGSDDCTTVTIRSALPSKPFRSSAMSAVLAVSLVDACNVTLSAAVTVSDLPRCPAGQLYSMFQAYDAAQGAVTTKNEFHATAVFSVPVSNLSTSSFLVEGPATAQTTSVKLKPGTSSTYTVSASLPADYHGPVRLSASPDITAVEGSSIPPIKPLAFMRVGRQLLDVTLQDGSVPSSLQA